MYSRKEKNIRKEKKILTKMCSRLFTLIVARINEAIKVIHFSWHKSLGRGPLSKNWLFIAKCDLQ